MTLFEILPEHGHVYDPPGPVDESLLIGVPGDEIPYELAEKLGLVKKPRKAVAKETVIKAVPTAKPEKAAKKLTSYPPKR